MSEQQNVREDLASLLHRMWVEWIRERKAALAVCKDARERVALQLRLRNCLGGSSW
jgi:hypothetical protein